MSHVELQPGFDFQQAGKEVLAIERECLAELDQYINQNFTLACERCSGVKESCRHGDGKIRAYWAKNGGNVCQHRYTFIFRPSREAAHGDLGMVTPQDVVIAISNSGESSEITALIPVLKRLHVPLICITGRPESSMARAADVHLCVKVAKEACPLGLAPTSSTTATLVMGDALAVALLKARGFTAEDFALTPRRRTGS